MKKTTPQQGITLIMAVLILSSVAVVSFMLAALVIREVKSSRILSKSESAIIAAEAGGETALYFRIRKLTTSLAATVSCPATFSKDLSAGMGSFSVCNEFYKNPYEFYTASSTATTNFEVIMLYDPTNQGLDPGYYSLEVQANTGTATSVCVKTYDLAGTITESQTCQAQAYVGGSPVIIGGLNPTKEYAVFLIPQGDNDNLEAKGLVTANGGTLGIPTKTPIISSTGVKDDLNRKLEILLGQ